MEQFFYMSNNEIALRKKNPIFETANFLQKTK